MTHRLLSMSGSDEFRCRGNCHQMPHHVLEARMDYKDIRKKVVTLFIAKNLWSVACFGWSVVHVGRVLFGVSSTFLLGGCNEER